MFGGIFGDSGFVASCREVCGSIKQNSAPCNAFCGILRLPAAGREGRAGGVGPDLPSEAALLAGQFNAKRIGLSLDVLLLCPVNG